MSRCFAAANRSERSLALDLKSAEGLDIVRQLAASADVLIDHFRIGALVRKGVVGKV